MKVVTNPRAAMVAEIDAIRSQLEEDVGPLIAAEDEAKAAMIAAQAAFAQSEAAYSARRVAVISRRERANHQIADLEHQLRTTAPAEVDEFVAWLRDAQNRARLRWRDDPERIARVIEAQREAGVLRTSGMDDGAILARIEQLKIGIGMPEGVRA